MGLKRRRCMEFGSGSMAEAELATQLPWLDPRPPNLFALREEQRRIEMESGRSTQPVRTQTRPRAVRTTVGLQSRLNREVSVATTAFGLSVTALRKRNSQVCCEEVLGGRVLDASITYWGPSARPTRASPRRRMSRSTGPATGAAGGGTAGAVPRPAGVTASWGAPGREALARAHTF